MTDNDNAGGSAPAGQGRLAQLIATRGGTAAPEAPFVIEHREALIYMLCEAAELEHGIMCQYLFAAFSLKQHPDEGLASGELTAVERWRKQVSHVAAQEMLHLALVQNLLSAIGAAPHLSRPNLPAPASHYPAGVQLALLPFGEQALRHFMFLERPEGMDLADADGLAAVGRAAPLMTERDIVPRGQDFATVGHLYRSIEAGFAHLSTKYGEDWLFTGPPRAQAAAAHFGWPELVAVTDLASAQRAIEEILEQGEGPRGHWRDAHFGQFVAILDEFHQLREANPGFDPARPVMAANVRQPERDVELPLIGDPLTARVTDLFNVGYEVLLQTLERFFAHTEETDAQLKTLADTTVGLMLRVIKPLGDLITTPPAGEAYPGMTAGPSFELFYESDYLMPHQEAAWALLAERLDEAAWLCDEIRSGRGKRIAGRLEPVLAAMREMSRTLAAQLPAGSTHARLAAAPATLEPAELSALVARAEGLAGAAADGDAADGGGAGPAGDLSELLATAHAIVVASASGQGCDSREQALIMPRLVDSVLRPLAGALGRPAGGAASPAPAAADGAASAADRAASVTDGAAPAADGAAPAAAGRIWQAARPDRRRRQTGAAGAGCLAGALRAVPVRALAEQAVLQRHALVRRVQRPGAAARPRADPVRARRRPSPADPDDQAAVRAARARRSAAGPAVRGDPAGGGGAAGGLDRRGVRRPALPRRGTRRPAAGDRPRSGRAADRGAAGPVGRPDWPRRAGGRAARRPPVPVGVLRLHRVRLPGGHGGRTARGCAAGARAPRGLGLGTGRAAGGHRPRAGRPGRAAAGAAGPR